MSYRNEKKPKFKYYRVMTIIIFCSLLIYLLGYLAVFVSRPSIEVETVEYGSIQVPHVYNGIVVREETVYRSDRTGRPVFNVADKTRVKKNTYICTVSDSSEAEDIESRLEKIDNDLLRKIKDGADNSLHRVELNQIERNIMGIVDSYASGFVNGDLSSMYNLRNQIDSEIDSRNEIWLVDSGYLETEESDVRDQYEEKLEQTTSRYYSETSGIVSLKYDDLESIYTPNTLESITLEDVEKYTGVNQISQSMNIEKGNAIYKIVTSNTWYIVSYIPNTALEAWEEGLRVNISAESDSGEEVSFIAEINSIHVDSMYTRVIFESNQKITDFLGVRNFEFSTKDTVYDGIKIPVSAIVERTLLKVPHEYIYEKEGSKGVLLKEKSGTYFVSIEEVMKEGDYTYILQNFENIKIGSTIINPDTKKELTVNDTYTCSGVYLGNTSIAKFTIVNIMGENNEYAIVEANTTYGLKIYDSIVSDASSIKEAQALS